MSTNYRTTRILALLAARPRGSTHVEVFAALREIDPAAKQKSTISLLHHLVRTGQATTRGSYKTRRFFPAKEPKPKPVTAPAEVAEVADPVPTTVATLPTGPMDSRDIARDIAAFKRRGGRIEKLSRGASANPLGTGHTAGTPRAGVAVRHLIRVDIANR